MAALWFMAGVCFTLTAIILLLPWLRTMPGLGSLPVLPWSAGIAALAAAGVVFGLCTWLQPANPTVVPQGAVSSTTPHAPNGPAPTGSAQNAKTAASPMNSAIASLQMRLAKGGGSADDWELLAKSYEFLGQPAQAGKARAHQLPALPADVMASSKGAP